MPVSIDFFIAGDSWLHRADPRLKFLLALCAAVTLLVVRHLILMLAALLLCLVLHRSAGVPRSRVLFVLKALLPVSLLMPVLWVVFYPSGPSLFEFWVLRVTWLSLLQGLTVAARINAMTLVVFAVLYTTDQSALVRGLVKLKLPYEWGLVLSLALRYIPNFQHGFTLISEAQQARGFDVGKATGFRRVRRMMPVLVPMMISSLRASEQLSYALEARALGAQGSQRTYFHDIHFGRSDVLLAALLLAITAAWLWLRFEHGFGADTLRLWSTAATATHVMVMQ